MKLRHYTAACRKPQIIWYAALQTVLAGLSVLYYGWVVLPTSAAIAICLVGCVFLLVNEANRLYHREEMAAIRNNDAATILQILERHTPTTSNNGHVTDKAS